ncbi:MAG: DUF2868 domain-containing protein [Dechloromonas sp.]|nr:DUF2868 domain-containing protein [Candidatus Dechloromonas phosphoritropha]MBP8785997.1 DUF2868 domain-containing protein [Azonexus sp.]MBP9226930.1 DUF2868 domain-containing protein [Azonexus sp.]
MTEDSARIVCLVKAFETAAQPEKSWSQADSVLIGDQAAREVAANTGDESFIRRRAELAWEKITARQPNLARLTTDTDWHEWLGWALVGTALLSGVLVDQVGPDNLINLTSFPLFGLLLWNTAVYAFLLGQTTGRLFGRQTRAPGPLRRAIAVIVGRFRSVVSGTADVSFRTAYWSDWGRVSYPLSKAYVSRLLHLAAAAFAAGIIVSLYYRGFFNEYVSGWKSTFVPAAARVVQWYVMAVLGAIPSFFGIPLPTADEIAALDLARHPTGTGAAPWIHRIALTVGFLVVLPRVLLAGWAWLTQQRLRRKFPIDLREAYYQRLLRRFRGTEARVVVVPYNYRITSQVALGLNRVVQELYDTDARLEILDPIAIGQEDNPPDAICAPDLAGRFVLFSLTSTPEDESHGTLLRSLSAVIRQGPPVISIIDESAFLKRFGKQGERLDERRALWARFLGGTAVAHVFCDLTQTGASRAFAGFEFANDTSRKVRQ